MPPFLSFSKSGDTNLFDHIHGKMDMMLYVYNDKYLDAIDDNCEINYVINYKKQYSIIIKEYKKMLLNYTYTLSYDYKEFIFYIVLILSDNITNSEKYGIILLIISNNNFNFNLLNMVTSQYFSLYDFALFTENFILAKLFKSYSQKIPRYDYIKNLRNENININNYIIKECNSISHLEFNYTKTLLNSNTYYEIDDGILINYEKIHLLEHKYTLEYNKTIFGLSKLILKHTPEIYTDIIDRDTYGYNKIISNCLSEYTWETDTMYYYLIHESPPSYVTENLSYIMENPDYLGPEFIKKLMENTRLRVDIFDAAFLVAPITQQKIIVYRGTGEQNLSYMHKQFVSTSTSYNTAVSMHNGTILTMEIDPNIPYINISSYIHLGSTLNEILLPRGLVYSVMSTTIRGYFVKVSLEYPDQFKLSNKYKTYKVYDIL